MTTSEPGGPPPTPKPAPRPGPPRPVPHPGRPAPTVAAPPTSDPHRFGRVDPDGTVWLITGAGERVIGSWQAGDTEAAFAHFGRRFDDLHTEVALMERRLASGTGDARKIKAAAASLVESLPTAAVLGDVDALTARLATIVEHADATAQAERARRDEHRAAQTARKEALAAEAEDLAANSVHWKAAGDRLREILEEWRTITGLDRKTDDALWKRFAAARETFNRRRGSHFAELDRERVGARQAMEALCERAEELAGSTDWGATGAVFRDLLAQWKAAGRAAKDVDDALWQRFKAAQDTFFTARNAASAERDTEFHGNAAAKEALLAEAEKIDAAEVTRRGRQDRRARHRGEVGRGRQGPPRAQRRAGTTASGRGEEGARRGVVELGRSGGSGPCRPVPFPGRAIRAAGGEGRGGRPDQGRRGGARQRRAVATVGRGGGRGARQKTLATLG